MKAKKTIGFYLVAASALLTIAGLVLYPGVFAKSGTVNTFLILSLVAAAAAVGTSFIMKNELTNLAAVAFSTLLILALGFSIAPMVTPIAYWYAGLYDYSTVSAYFTFAAVCGAAWVLSAVSTFTGMIRTD
jgi:hypothetical protein